MGGGVGRRVVSDEEFERMDRIGLFHLLFFLPGGGGFVVEGDVAIVLW